MSFDKILESFNDKNYDKLDSIIDDHITYKTYYDKNNLLHVSLFNEKFDLFLYLLDKKPELSYLVNNHNMSPLHLFFDMIFDMISDTMNDIDNDINKDKYITYATYTLKIIDIITQYMQSIDIYSKNNKGINIMEYLILLSKYPFYVNLVIKSLNKIIQKEKEMNKKIQRVKYNELLHFALEKSLCIQIIKFILLNMETDINSYNEKSLSPLLISLKNNLDINIIKYLLESGSNIDYSGNNDKYLPINISLKYLSSEITELLLTYKPNLLQRDNEYNTPLHNILLHDFILNKINKKNFSTIIENSDLNIQNLNGDTCFYLLCKLNLVEQFNDILKYKNIDFFIRNDKNKTPLTYIGSNTFIKLLDVMANTSLKYKLRNLIKGINNKKYDFANIEKCRTLIKSQILIPKIETNIELKLPLNLPIIITTNFTIFNSDIVHNVIYLIQILRKYHNVFIPHQYFSPDKNIDMLIKLKNRQSFTTEYGKIIYQFINIYTYNFFEMMPHLILWRDVNTYHNFIDLDFYIKKSLRNDKIRFLLFKLTLIPLATVVHANIIIYDKKLNKIERFEPYGSTKSLMKDDDKIDIYLKNLFKKNINNEIKYVGPKDFMTQSKFQLISSENDIKNRKITDPVGYCLAWCLWFVELRLSNPDISSKTLVDEAINKIINKEGDKYSELSETNIKKDIPDDNNIILSHIRNYSKKLNQYKISFFKEIGIDLNSLNNIKQNDVTQELIFSYITESFNKLIEERYS